MSCNLLYVGLSQYNYKPVSQRSRVAPHVTLTYIRRSFCESSCDFGQKEYHQTC